MNRRDHLKLVLGIDAWDRAYYLDYQAKRAEYRSVWGNTLNWDKVAADVMKARV